MRLFTALLSISLFLPTDGVMEGRVISVFDGDTVTVLHNKKRIKVRLEGIDAPERAQNFGSKSKSALEKLVRGKTVRVEEKGVDEYGRVLGIVTLDEKSINEQMISDGWAWHDKQSNTDSRLSDLETQASTEGRGLWSDRTPTPPWEFRQQQELRLQQQALDRYRASRSTNPSNGGAFWLNTSSNVRHNSSCQHFRNTSQGRACTASEGRACGICGG